MSAGMIAHHSWGLAVSKAAAASMATTTHKRTAILRAHKPMGNTRMDPPPRETVLYLIGTSTPGATFLAFLARKPALSEAEGWDFFPCPTRSRPCMHHPQPKHLLKAIEIPIPVQQFVRGLQTKSSNQTIDGLVNRIAPLP
jgi:hypothetical protein